MPSARKQKLNFLKMFIVPGCLEETRIPSGFVQRAHLNTNSHLTVHTILDTFEFGVERVNGRWFLQRDEWLRFVAVHSIEFGEFVYFRHRGQMVFDGTVIVPSMLSKKYDIDPVTSDAQTWREYGLVSKKTTVLKAVRCGAKKNGCWLEVEEQGFKCAFKELTANPGVHKARESNLIFAQPGIMENLIKRTKLLFWFFIDVLSHGIFGNYVVDKDKCKTKSNVFRFIRQDTLCKNCRRPGHFAQECPNDAVCNNCGLPGHIAAECTSRTMCWNCKEASHLASQCNNDPTFHICNKKGHLARECFESSDSRVCNKCFKAGHIAIDCTNEKACNNCRETGHIAHDCVNEPVCNLCNVSSHVARQCPKTAIASQVIRGPFLP
ncbi:hypothetical protein BUALT_Bualt11G0119000 [Buddleja alternifolia]|uniref:CCHC-type domain-containing protein n=1 Tax=Buddleja alternifolia TaxID=168488 RepID=A0AAV6WV79_9LAMI|nr:hypothetical protein BUALT_Bualt11G0119000 [Buddleja alternifolia]